MRFAFLLLPLWIGAHGCGGPEGATCEEHLCSEEYSGELLHEQFSHCVECTALTDSCVYTLVGEDGEVVERCDSCAQGCDRSCTAELWESTTYYCTGSL